MKATISSRRESQEVKQTRIQVLVQAREGNRILKSRSLTFHFDHPVTTKQVANAIRQLFEG